MLLRAAFILVTVFWLAMNVLLWRSEYGTDKERGSPVPVEVVAGKILTAPDASSLTVLYQGQRVGFAHWHTSVGEELSSLREEDDPTSPEGMVRRVTGYRVQLEGSLVVPESTHRLRFEGTLDLDPERAWRSFTLKVILRPTTWSVRILAAEETAEFTVEEDGQKTTRRLGFRDLRQPERLAGTMTGPMLSALLSAFPLPLTLDQAQELGAALRWDSRHGTLGVGHSSVRVYRLEGELLEKYRMTLLVSRVGEILRVELPGEVLLTNDQLPMQ